MNVLKDLVALFLILFVLPAVILLFGFFFSLVSR
jgi:hypothetical protein